MNGKTKNEKNEKNPTFFFFYLFVSRSSERKTDIRTPRVCACVGLSTVPARVWRACVCVFDETDCVGGRLRAAAVTVVAVRRAGRDCTAFRTRADPRPKGDG